VNYTTWASVPNSIRAVTVVNVILMSNSNTNTNAMDYAAEIWDPYLDRQVEHLEQVQRKAM